MAEIFTAKEVHDLVVDIFASGSPNWPVSRTRLKGLRLRQVSDAIKIYVAQVYLRYLNGDASQHDYEQLKSSWGGLLVQVPEAFVREETWREFEHLEPKERYLKLILEGIEFASNREIMNEEELELFDDEPFDSFIVYLEKIGGHARNPFDHVLGHLSRGYIYFDDTIPVLPPSLFISREQQAIQLESQFRDMVNRTRNSPPKSS